jgi:hypothetical protein
LLRWHHCFNFSEVAQSLLVQSELLGKVKASWGSREAARMQPTAQAAGGQRTKKKPRHGGKDCSDFSRQSGYRVFSVNVSNVAPVPKYIAGQEEHHKKQSFQEKILAFLKKNKVVYDERYIWDSFLSSRFEFVNQSSPLGLGVFPVSTHGLRRRLHSCAASRLTSQALCQARSTVVSQ